MGGRGWWGLATGLCALVAVAPAQVRAQVAVAESNAKKTLDCGGHDATVTGSLNNLTLTGECPSVTIKGSENTIAIEAVGQIRVVGTKNKVTWQRATVEKGPVVTRSGLGNVVKQAAASASAGAGGGGAASSAASSASSGSLASPTTSTSASIQADGGGSPIVVSDEKATKTINCRGRGVNVMGNGNRLTLTGACRKVDVWGNENVIDVDTVLMIATGGNHNRVTWTHAAEGDAPATDNLGNGNTIRRKTAPLP